MPNTLKVCEFQIGFFCFLKHAGESHRVLYCANAGRNHLRDGRSITRICDAAAREFRRPKITSSGANYSNLLNIQIATLKENTTAAKTKATTQPSRSKFLKSKLQIAHLNVRLVKERNHLIQLRELMREKNYDVLAISESWLNSTTTTS